MAENVADNVGGRLRELAESERPQERLERLGPGALSDSELLAMLLRSGSKDLDVLSLARQIMREAGSLSGLVSYTAEDFRRFHGVGAVKALQLVTVMEVARRVWLQGVDEKPQITSAGDVYRFLQPRLAGLQVEKFWTLALNSKRRLVKLTEVTSGTVSQSLAHPREVFREAIRQGAAALICAHNHPSGDPAPSRADIQLTATLVQAGYVLGIQVLDHVICDHGLGKDGQGTYYSFAESGTLLPERAGALGLVADR